MRKKEFVKAIAKQVKHLNLPEDAIDRMSGKIFGELMNVIKNGGRAEIRGFGSFFSRRREQQLLRNPRTGKLVETPARSIPRFKAGKKLAQKINRSG